MSYTFSGVEEGERHIKTEYRNPATVAVLSKDQSPVLFKFPRTLQAKTGWKSWFL